MVKDEKEYDEWKFEFEDVTHRTNTMEDRSRSDRMMLVWGKRMERYILLRKIENN